MTAKREITVRHTVGLHARPAAMFVKTAMAFSSQIQVENLSKGTDTVDARSILGVLASCVNQDDRIRIIAEGDDEEKALAALCDLIERNFDESL